MGRDCRYRIHIGGGQRLRGAGKSDNLLENNEYLFRPNFCFNLVKAQAKYLSKSEFCLSFGISEVAKLTGASPSRGAAAMFKGSIGHAKIIHVGVRIA